jgi:asparagine synthase (glutamine-hydrolysing)
VCGIAGLVLARTGAVKTEWMESLYKHLEHRGPDDAGWLSFRKDKISLGKAIARECEADLVLVHRRLSILDLSEAGWQPMSSSDRRYWVIFNGEIYNYLEVRKQLEACGHHFRSRSDTEVLVEAFDEWGPQCLTYLLGMFAFVILDVKRRNLFLARDVFGIKPLYYTTWRDGFAFASEIKPLINLPDVDRSVNAERLFEYLQSGVTDYGGETLYAHVKQLPAASYMEVSLDNPRAAEPICYWKIDLNQKADLSFDEAAKQLRDLFLDSISLHLRSDVPVGAALSGGIDSSSIVAAMRLLDPKLEIHTFSYVADDPTISEERWVDIVSKAANVMVHKVRPRSGELMIDSDHLIEIQEQPFMSTSMYAQYRVFQQAHEAGIKVMLDGQGADELLGGYPTYRIARICSLLRQGHYREAMRFSRKTSTPGGPWELMRSIGRLAPARIQAALRHALGRDVMPLWLNASWFIERGVQPGTPEYTDDPHMLRYELYQTLTGTMLPQLLRYDDRNSMAFSIESRVPFLTPTLANFLFALPEDYIISADGITKSVFRRAMRGIVPDAILDRRDKMGFPTTERRWLMSSRSWVEHMLKSQTANRIRAFNIREIHQEWERIIQGNQNLDSRVWRWVNLILWVQKFSVTME